MKITIITVGKLKEKYWKQAVDEYNKRLGAYTKTELIEVADEKAPDNMSDKDIEIVKEKEADRIMSKIKQDSYVITLEIQGKMLTSEGLSKEIDNLMTRGNSQKVLQRSNYALSFSKMTFPHQMMKVILMEQVYRAFKIMRGEAYHK